MGDTVGQKNISEPKRGQNMVMMSSVVNEHIYIYNHHPLTTTVVGGGTTHNMHRPPTQCVGPVTSRQ